jgi:UPF0755 protein
MNDFLPPKRPLSQNARPGGAPVRPNMPARPLLEAPEAEPLIEPAPKTLLLDKPRRSVKKIFLWITLSLFVIAVLAVAGAYAWYSSMLAPLNAQSTEKISVDIVEGSSSSEIGKLLEEKKVIRSGFAFDIYTRLSGKRSALQAGTYSLASADSIEQIVARLTSGSVDEITVTFLPGATLAENRKVLIKAGFSEAAVDAALSKTYSHPLLADKPASADLEGYLYGETYSFPVGTTVSDIIMRTFDEFYAQVESNDFVAKFKTQGLNLYQGITLASIIQREVSGPTDQKQVAQIFFKRLKIDMPLGSDVTAYYGADKKGVERSVAVDTPYNTRIHKGLPPGPISTPGLTALQAVAAPANGDYIYFLSGDDGVTYYALTDEGHQDNIKNHCQVKCAVQ